MVKEPSDRGGVLTLQTSVDSISNVNRDWTLGYAELEDESGVVLCSLSSERDSIIVYNPTLNSRRAFCIKPRISFDENIYSLGVLGSHLLLHCTSGFLTIHQNGEVLDTLRMERNIQINGESMILGEFSESSLTVPVGDSIFVNRIYPLEIPYWSTDFYSRYIDVLIYPKTGEQRVLPVSYPSNYQEFNFGSFIRVYRVLRKSELIYSFPCTHELYVLDVADSRLRNVIQREPIEHTRPFEPFDTMLRGDLNQYLAHASVNPSYGPFIYDKYRDLFYRIYYDGQEQQDDAGNFRDLFDRPAVLLVLDSTLHVIHREFLGRDFNTQHMFVLPKGLYINSSDQKSKYTGYARYEVFEFH